MDACRRLQRRWSRRRYVNSVLLFVEASTMLLNLTSCLVSNIHALVRPCAWHGAVPLLAAFISWSCWNTLFAIAAVRALHAHAIPWCSASVPRTLHAIAL